MVTITAVTVSSPDIATPPTDPSSPDDMEFFDRTDEIALLRKIRSKSHSSAQFTVVTGRRRIGKTSLVVHAYAGGGDPMLYFFVGRKAERLLCEEFRQEVEGKLGVRLGGAPNGFAELLEYLLLLSVERPFTLFVDEFQNFERVNPAVFSDIQKLWDLHSGRARINLVVCGSIYSMMTRLFRDNKEPLYNRQSRFMTLHAFRPSVLKEILAAYSPAYTPDDLLALYAMTGGVPKYVSLLIDNDALTLDSMIDEIVSPDSTFIGEGRAILVEEFGKEYDTYFSILSAIASGKRRRSEIESVVDCNLGGYLARLDDDYGVISKETTLGSKPLSKNTAYSIRDNFFTFWFRFLFKYGHFLEIEAYEQLRALIRRDYVSFSGGMLERYFRDKAVESRRYTAIGRWWDRKGENEIDLIAVNELERTIEFYEVKRNPRHISLPVVEAKASRMLAAVGCYGGFTPSYGGLSLADM